MSCVNLYVDCVCVCMCVRQVNAEYLSNKLEELELLELRGLKVRVGEL